MFPLSLPARLKGTGVESYACHPGLTRTDIFHKGDHEKMTTIITDWGQWLAGQSAESGALSLLYCATAPELQGERDRGRGRGGSKAGWRASGEGTEIEGSKGRGECSYFRCGA